MTKRVKRILWAVGITVGLLTIAALILYINFRQAIKSMTPVETFAVNDSVWCLKDRFVNAYIFKGEKNYLAVDAGISKRIINEEMTKLHIDPKKVTTILLTHSDGDHTGAAELFKNAAIYMHRDEEQMINGTTARNKFSKTKWKYGPYKLLDSNDTLTIDGLKIKILHTPGHTPGSSCYIIGTDYLVTGDNLIVVDGKYDHFTEMFNMDTRMQTESIKLLPAPGSFRYILTAHNGVAEISRLGSALK
jgi:glyoxylase-like metal-dependent hydrolase (beta-lactamase superfamily II)